MNTIKMILFIVAFTIVFNAENAIGDDANQTQTLQINKLISRYFQTEEYLWIVIERREENTLEQIYNEHKTVLNDNKFMNVIERMRITVDFELIKNLKFLNETSTRVYNILKSRDYGELNKFARSDRVQNVTDAIEAVSRLCNTTDFWRDLENDGKMCKQHYTLSYQAEHQTVVEVYKDIETVVWRGYIVAQLSYMIQGLRDKVKYKNQSQILNKIFHEHRENMTKGTKLALEYAGREVSSCSPDNYIFESTEYETVNGFLQGFVDNEINFNVEGTCGNTCYDYKQTKQHGCHDDTPCAVKNNKLDRIKRCNGVIHDCEFIESDLEICPSIIDHRRYKYLKYENGRVLGDHGGCSQVLQARSWSDWFVRCHNCFCLCEENHPAADHYFNLRDVVSDIHSNFIVTGIHIAKPNRLIELVISERKLLSYGQLKATNNYFHYNFPSWKRAEPRFNLNDSSVREGIDYHTLTYDKRAINFDTIILPQGQVLTGVRFHLHNGHIRMEVRGTDFDFETGTLFNLENSTWYGNENSGRQKIVLNNSKPIGLMGQPIVNIIPDSYVEFTPSDKDTDASQTIVPFLETTKVEPIFPTILAGAGLYYKGKPGHGGVVAPKLVVADFNTLI